MPFIKKEKLTFSHEILGVGGFGVVQKERLNMTKVAIKSLDLFKNNHKYILRELYINDIHM